MTKKSTSCLPLNLQFFADPIDTVGGLDALMDSAEAGTSGTTEDTTATNTDTNTETTETSDAEQDQTEGTEGTATTEKPAAVQTPPAIDKAAQKDFAFGQLRTQNKAMTDLLGQVAKANGIEYTNTQDLLSKLNNDVLTKQAAQTNVPVELLSRMQQLEQNNAEFLAVRTQERLVENFTRLTTEYGLNEKELTQFASEVAATGIDITASNVDLFNLYKLTHLDDIISRESKKAVEDALKKSTEADSHSTNPLQLNGSGGSTNGKITNLAQLDSFLAKVNI